MTEPLLLPQWAASLKIPGHEHIRRWLLSLGIPVKSSDYDKAFHPLQISNDSEDWDRWVQYRHASYNQI